MAVGVKLADLCGTKPIRKPKQAIAGIEQANWAFVGVLASVAVTHFFGIRVVYVTELPKISNVNLRTTWYMTAVRVLGSPDNVVWHADTRKDETNM
jgi:hypothetical protein